MKVLHLALITGLLSGCIDTGTDEETTPDNSGSNGGGNTTPEIESFSGRVADGYLDGATVCLDMNMNKACDANEPTSTSGAGGVFTMDATQEQRDLYPLLVEVVVGVTVDEDNAGVPLSKPLTLTAPAGYGFVSPLTTMVQSAVEAGSTQAEAKAAVQAKLGTTLDLDSDYVAGKLTGANANEYAQLHHVAQVAARVIAANMDELNQSANDNNIEVDVLISAIIGEVFKALDEIKTQVAEIAADETQTFNPDTLATTVNDDLIDLDPETIVDQIDQIEAEDQAVGTNLGAVMKDGGLSWFSTEAKHLGGVWADYGTISLDVNNNFNDAVFELENEAFVQAPNDNTDIIYVLTANGWTVMPGGDSPSTATTNEDGSVSFRFGSADIGYTRKLSAEEVDLSGLNARSVMNSVDEGEGLWGDYLSSTAVMPEGSKGYITNYDGSDEPFVYWGYDDCGQLVGDLCEYAWVYNGGNLTDGQATSFSDLTSPTAYTLTGNAVTDTSSILAVMIGTFDPTNNYDSIWAEIVTEGNVVNYYQVSGSLDSITLLGSSTWAISDLSSSALELQPIPSILNQYTEYGNHNPVLALVNGIVRVAEHKVATGYSDSEFEFVNGVARDAVIGASFSEDNLTPTVQVPATVVDACLTGNTDWDLTLQDIAGSWGNAATFQASIDSCIDTQDFFVEGYVNGQVSTGMIDTDSVMTYLSNGRGYRQKPSDESGNFWFTWKVESGYSSGDLIVDYTNPNTADVEKFTAVQVKGDQEAIEYKVYTENELVTNAFGQLGFINSAVLSNSSVNDSSTATVASEFDQTTIPGTYTWASSAHAQTDNDAIFTFAEGGTGSVHWGADIADLIEDSGHTGYFENLEWFVDTDGRLLVTLWSTVGNTEGAANDELQGVERYTIVAGTQTTGTVTRESIGSNGQFTTAKMDDDADVSFAWTKAAEM